MVNQYGNKPCMLLTNVRCGKLMDKSIDFERDGKRIFIDRRLLQASFTDGCGDLVFAGLVPVSGWTVKLDSFSGHVVDVLVCGMTDSKEGFTILHIMGIQDHETTKRVGA